MKISTLRNRQQGYLLPIIIALGLGVSAIGFTALNIISQNSQTLSNQYYSQLANEAAKAGATAAIKCINAGMSDWDTGGKPKLAPQTDCHGATVAGKQSVIFNSTTLQTTYTVKAIEAPFGSTSSVITSIGTATLKTLAGINVQTFSKSVRVLGSVNFTGSIVSDLDVHGDFGCAVVNNKAYCWGSNSLGQLGVGKDSGSGPGQIFNSGVPVAVDTSGALSGKTIQSVSTGDSYACALTTDAQVYCWGDDTYGQLGNNDSGGGVRYTAPVAINTSGVLAGKTIKQISAGGDHTCALTSDGKAYCWGRNSNGQIGDGTQFTDRHVPTAVIMTGVLAGKTITQISAGDDHTCALASDGKAYCWGDGSNGELGNGNSGSGYQALVPVAVTTSGVLSGKTVTDISAGNSYTCAVANSQAYCWGSGDSGKLGFTGAYGDYNTPVAVTASGVLNGKTVTDIDSGDSHTCAIASGQSYCWGSNLYGQLGNNTSNASQVPVAVDTSGIMSGKTVTEISAGYDFFSCGIADSKIYCWGNNGGNLGDGNKEGTSWVPVATTATWATGQSVSAIDAHSSHACAIVNGLPFCWGMSAGGQLGTGKDYGASNGQSGNVGIPVPVVTSGVLSGKTVTSISTGDGFTCALANSQAYCWGTDTYGQLGNGQSGGGLSFNVPIAVDTSGALAGKTLTQISAGGDHTCALTSDGKAYCWGNDNNGQIGDNTQFSNRLTPTAVNMSGVLAGKTLTQITAGDDHTCALASDGKVYCWGNGGNGQLGNGNSGGGYHSLVPVAVTSTGVLNGKTVTKISAGSSYTCAVASGLAYCWGSGDSGKLGFTNAYGDYNTPVAVTTSGVLNGKTVTDIDAGESHTCAVASGQGYCWGSNSYGNLGNNSSSASQVPVAIYTAGLLNGKTVTTVDAGYDFFSCGIANSKAYCWGNDTNMGTLGDGDQEGSSQTPVAVVLPDLVTSYSFDNPMSF